MREEAREQMDTLRARPRRLLAVFAHPDDESYGCAGALAREGAREDAATALLCLTRGEASRVGRESGLTPDEVGALREERLEKVRGIVGLDALVVRSFPDGRLARSGLDDVAESVVGLLDLLEPQVVIGHCPRGVNGHADHVAAHWAVRLALLARPGIRFAMVAYPPAVCEAAKPRLLFPTAEAEIDVRLALTEHEREAKEACLRAHDALVTLREDGDPGLLRRPAVETYDLLGEEFEEPLTDLFAQRSA